MSVASSDTAVRTGRITRTFLYLVLLLFALFYLLPFGVMLVNSVKPLEEITGAFTALCRRHRPSLRRFDAKWQSCAACWAGVSRLCGGAGGRLFMAWCRECRP